ncbi:choline dehydrogenase [Rhizophagus clarus]|uniref:Cholesterol oxidase n=1 Tax=Rhizophagus clarus TaxID=94130 RepID=A0A8H3KW75_9GLOM|nr:choline dehydrogenase [Rhizophagus clarus]
MFQPCQYPAHFPELPKLRTLEIQARLLGKEYHKNFYRAPITVTFENRVNAAGVRQRASTLTGNDVTGINDGSKNSTLMNYIPDAWNHGCEIFCECEVRSIKKCKKTGRYIVFYEWLDDKRTNFTDDNRHSLFFVIADIVFLAAGTFGSNDILLRSRTYGLNVSDRLGKGFSGNGGIIGLGYNTDYFVNCVGPIKDNTASMKVPVGPCITGIIDMHRDVENVLEGYVIEEGTIPGSTGKIFQLVLEVGSLLIGTESNNTTLSRYAKRLWRKIKSPFNGVYSGATSHTQTYLIMSHDDNTGQIELVNDRLKVSYNGVGSELITVHPIGGCSIGKYGKHGVVNHKGQVFVDDSNVHKGLYVCDGSIIPTALGVNPFLTISALTERICEYAAKDREWEINYDLVTKPIDFDRPLITYERKFNLTNRGHILEGGISFTEVMRGYFSTEVLSADYFAAELEMDDHSALITGTVSCRALSPDPLLVTSGKFRLFIPKTDKVDSNQMMYDLNLFATGGTKYRFKGYELIKNGTFSEQATSTTTLYILIMILTEEEADIRKVVGRGILRIKPSDLLKQLTTFRATGETSESRIKAIITFKNFFVTTILKHIFVRFLPLVYSQVFPVVKPFYYKNRPQKEIWEITAEDGVKSLLHRYQGGRKGPILFVHGASMSHEMWTTNLVKNNIVDYLLERGYDIFLIDNRLSTANIASKEQQTLDDVRLDQAAATKKIREITGVEKIGIISHCTGSIVTFMGLLDGKIGGVGCLIASQVAMHPFVGFWNRVKMYLNIIPFTRYILRQSLFDARTSSETNLTNKILDQLLRFYPVPKGQNCRNALCHRTSFCYGTLYQHENINQQIHDYQNEFVGIVNLTTMQHLVKVKFSNLYHSGDKNVVFDLKSAKKSYDALRLVNGADNYVYNEINNYGHSDVWWGTNANEDVFPKVLNHLEETQHLWGYTLPNGFQPFDDSPFHKNRSNSFPY